MNRRAEFDNSSQLENSDDASELFKVPLRLSETKLTQAPPAFNFNDVIRATNNFNDAKKLGSGTFGDVYEAKMNLNGQETTVAVKKFKIVSRDSHTVGN